MAWTTPVLIEICIGLEINGYLPAGTKTGALRPISPSCRSQLPEPRLICP